MTKTKIRNCPWCGNKPTTRKVIELWHIGCKVKSCPVQPSLQACYLSEEIAIRMWNKREVFY